MDNMNNILGLLPLAALIVFAILLIGSKGRARRKGGARADRIGLRCAARDLDDVGTSRGASADGSSD